MTVLVSCVNPKTRSSHGLFRGTIAEKDPWFFGPAKLTPQDTRSSVILEVYVRPGRPVLSSNGKRYYVIVVLALWIRISTTR